MSLDLFLCLPLAGAVAMFFMQRTAARSFGVMVCVLQLVLGVSLYAGADDAASLTSFHSWLPSLGLNWSLGLDGANLWLVLLCPLLTALALLTAASDLDRLGLYSANLVLLGGLLCGLFLAQNLGLFYIFFEAILIPAVVLVAGWSRVDGRQTAQRFIMFTLAGSLPMLLGVLILAFSALGSGVASLEFRDLAQLHLVESDQVRIFFLFIFAFLVKMPLLPLHGWMIPLYRNAPASAVVIIAALMSKAGMYGLVKIGYTIFPLALQAYLPYLLALALLSILYGALSALSADSLREVLAFSSLSHIGLIALGIVTKSGVGPAGAILQMAGHALATGGLFLVLALMEKRGLPDELRRYGGMAQVAPRFAAITLFLTLAGLGQPGLGSFPGELYILTGVFGYNWVIAAVAGLRIIFAAMYMLRWYQTIFTGELGTFKVPPDLTGREMVLLCVPIALGFLMGFVPSLFLTPIQGWLKEFF